MKSLLNVFIFVCLHVAAISFKRRNVQNTKISAKPREVIDNDLLDGKIAVILVDHGSRIESANENLKEVLSFYQLILYLFH